MRSHKSCDKLIFRATRLLVLVDFRWVCVIQFVWPFGNVARPGGASHFYCSLSFRKEKLSEFYGGVFFGRRRHGFINEAIVCGFLSEKSISWKRVFMGLFDFVILFKWIESENRFLKGLNSRNRMAPAPFLSHQGCTHDFIRSNFRKIKFLTLSLFYIGWLRMPEPFQRIFISNLSYFRRAGHSPDALISTRWTPRCLSKNPQNYTHPQNGFWTTIQ